MRELVGEPSVEAFENRTGAPVFTEVPVGAYRAVFDFGCGCGRNTRQLIQQIPRPERYVGLDLHQGMIRWCAANLAPRATGFAFHHHDVYNRTFNPEGVRPPRVPFPVGDAEFSLVIAHSVFTHLLEGDAEFYLGECARILEQDGILRSTWFLFDKQTLPMMQEFQNALYINIDDPTNAVIFDREWLRTRVAGAGLAITLAIPPRIRGFQWTILMAPAGPGVEPIDLPDDDAPIGLARPPLAPAAADQIGLVNEVIGGRHRRGVLHPVPSMANPPLLHTRGTGVRFGPCGRHDAVADLEVVADHPGATRL